jgi:hypothetical protein
LATLFTPQFQWLWTLALAAALYLPVRQLIWVLYVRRAERDGADDEARRDALKRRAGYTSVLLCFVFSYFYVLSLFQDGP